MPKKFNTIYGKSISLPVFFPDATRGVIRSLDSVDVKDTKTPGVLVNTYHLKLELGNVLNKFDGIRKYMNWDGAVISDSGGFQVMSIAKKTKGAGKVTDEGVTFKPTGLPKMLLTPEESIRFQMDLKTDMVVVLDDFTPRGASYQEAQETVRRTVLWAERSKREFEKECRVRGLAKKQKPYLLGVVQGGDYLDLRKDCINQLTKIGFDGLGYGGWPIDENGKFNYKVAETIAQHTPKEYLLYGLGIGKPNEVVKLFHMGYTIFDCVLPTRDARHKRMYVFNSKSVENINVTNNFWKYYVPDKSMHLKNSGPVSSACDCLLCTNYSRSYLAHLFKINETLALRLATIHNLRFYSLLMERLSDLQSYKK